MAKTTPLHEAVWKGDIEAIAKLRNEAGEKWFELLTKKTDPFGDTPLHIAARKENEKAIDELFRGLTQDERDTLRAQEDSRGRTPPQSLNNEGGSVEKVVVALGNNQDAPTASSTSPAKPKRVYSLRDAALDNNVAAIVGIRNGMKKEQWIDALGAESPHGDTPLRLAVRAGHEEAIAELFHGLSEEKRKELLDKENARHRTLADEMKQFANTAKYAALTAVLESREDTGVPLIAETPKPKTPEKAEEPLPLLFTAEEPKQRNTPSVADAPKENPDAPVAAIPPPARSFFGGTPAESNNPSRDNKASQPQQALGNILALTDHNDDGATSWSEFKTFVATRGKEVAKFLDTNGDGKLDARELGGKALTDAIVNSGLNYNDPRIIGGLPEAAKSLAKMLHQSGVVHDYNAPQSPQGNKPLAELTQPMKMGPKVPGG